MTEEQRKQNTKFMIRYMSIITGIIGAYIGAYVAGLMSQHGVDLGTAFRMIPSQLGDFQFLPPLNAAAVAGIFIGGGVLWGDKGFFPEIEFELKNNLKMVGNGRAGGVHT